MITKLWKDNTTESMVYVPSDTEKTVFFFGPHLTSDILL